MFWIAAALKPTNLMAFSFRCRFIHLLSLLLIAGTMVGCANEDDTLRPNDQGLNADQISNARKKAMAAADSILANLSLEEKIGQLLLISPPVDIGREPVRVSFGQFLDSLQPCGVLLPPSLPEYQRIVTRDLQAQNGVPRWFGLSIDDDWAAGRDYPGLITLGTSNRKDLLSKWGMAIGQELRDNGIQFCFSSATKVSPDTFALPNSMGGDPLAISDRAGWLMEGLRSAGVTPCFRSLPEPTDLPSDSVTFPAFQTELAMLISRDLLPIERLLPKDLPAIQLGAIRLPHIDHDDPVPFSGFVAETLIRKGMRYSGLIVGPFLSDSLLEAIPDAHVRCLQSGADLVPAGLHGRKAAAQIKQAVKKGLLPEAELNAKAHRILTAKLMQGFNSFVPPVPDSLRWNRPNPAEITARLLTESGLAVVRNDGRRLPLAGVESMKVHALSIGSSNITPFQREMGVYMDVEESVVQWDAAQSLLDLKLAALKKHNWVLVGLHNPDEKSLPPAVLKFLHALSKATHVAVVNFGPPRRLAKLDSLHSLVQANDNRPITQSLASQLLFGAIETNGSLPIELSPRFCLGDGLPCNKVFRFKYTVPEELDIEPRRMFRVDSIIHEAIYRGTFPGCQVFAAKDGKVFYHKAFGHHSYDQKIPVRRGDLYDIASITKVAATTLATMYAYDQDSIRLDGVMKDYIPKIDSLQFRLRDTKVSNLLIHKAGLPPGLPTYYYFTTTSAKDSIKKLLWSSVRDTLHKVQVTEDLYFNYHYLDTIWRKTLTIWPASTDTFKYSDMSMFLMKQILEARFKTRIDSLLDRVYYRPMGLRTTTYRPTRKFELDRIAPTEDDKFFRKTLIQGFVHDPTAALFGGIGGHAGLFSNAEDLGIIFQMLLNGGQYGGKRYLKEETVRLFTSRFPGSHRGLGFDMQSPFQDYSMCCKSASAACFGHLGFTGTCVWADPKYNIVFVFLSNRVHPSSTNQKINIHRVRQAVQEAIYQALGIQPQVQDCFTGEVCEDPLHPGYAMDDCPALDSILQGMAQDSALEKGK